MPGPDPASLDRSPDPAHIEAFHQRMGAWWHPVARTRALRDGELLPVVLLGRRLVLARLDGEAVALADACRHFQARLSLGEIVEHAGRACVRCPYHGWTYGADGRCVRIPQLGPDGRIPAGAAVPRYRTTEHLDLIWVLLAEEPRAPLPDYPEFDAPDFRTVVLDEPSPTGANALRLLLGTLDDTHFPWVHEGILGTREQPAPPDHATQATDHGLVTRYALEQPVNRATADLSAGTRDGTVRVRYTNHVHLPTVIRLVKDGPDGRYVIWLAASPTDWCTTTAFWAFSRNYDLDPASDEKYRAFSLTVRDQDRPVIESQRPVLVPPLSAGVSLALAGPDEPLVATLRALDALDLLFAPA